MQNYVFIINLVFIIICSAIGSFFLAIPIPKQTYLHNYKISIKILAIAYFIIAFLNALLLFLNQNEYTPEYINFIVILLSSLQAILFTFTLITLFNPTYINRKIVFYNCLPVFIFSVLYVLSIIFFDEYKIVSIKEFINNIFHPNVIIKFLFFIFYFLQLNYFIFIFFREEKIYITKIENYFSETRKVRMKWVKLAFILALSIGIIVLFLQVFPSEIFEFIFTIINVFFYFIFAIKYLNYNKIFNDIEPIIENQYNEIKAENIAIRYKVNWVDYKEVVIKEKYYLIEGVTLEEVALKLKVGRTTLSNLINTEEGVNFNSWINQLRIEEAKKIIKTNPDFTIQKVAELTGYSEHSNFSRQFKNFTGITPNQWRKELLC